ncbi:MAG: translocation/assembly module TamB domain-containing protein [Pseudomonadota bacterium]
MQAEESSPPVRQRRWLKALAAVLVSTVLLAVLATTALWVWAGTDGSLATGLRWVAQYQPLRSEGAAGSLRKGGEVKRLLWQKDGMTVEASNVTLSWQPFSLLQGTLKLNRFGASSVRIDDQRAPSTTPLLPPVALDLPLRIALDDFAIGVLQWAGPPAWEVKGISGNYLYTGLSHELKLGHAQFASGHYEGKATLGSLQPLQLDALFSGTLDAPVPGRTSTLPLSFTASAKGPLVELAVRAAMQMQATTTTRKITANAPHATATARITAWAAQPVTEADASFRSLNIAALWPDAPQTALTGQASVRPSATTTSVTTAAWVLNTKITNELPGPWDKKRLPLENLQAQGEWRNGAAVIRTLKAGVGGGELLASGEWLGTPPSSTPTSKSTSTSATIKQDWALQATLQRINPALLHTQLAALPLDGKATARSLGPLISFDAGVQSAGGAAAKTNPLAQLRLRDATATGSWNAAQAGGTLLLSALRIRTDDAELAGTLQAQAAARGGNAQLKLAAPGIDAQLQGELRPASGAGTLKIDARDAQQALRWLQRLPGIPAAWMRASAAGKADLNLNWQGGWQDPALQARLDVPSLDWRTPGAAVMPASVALSTSTTFVNTTTAAPPATLKFRNVQASVAGKLSQAQIAVNGRLEADQRRYNMQLAADGGRITSGRQDATQGWDTAAWQAVIKQFNVSAEDPALGEGTWRLATRNSFNLRWTPASTGSTLETSAGEAVLIAPTRTNVAASQAVIQWQPVRWRGKELLTAGKITGLPLAWIELFAGPQMAGAGLTGNLVFDGAWDATLGDKLSVKASLARASGDITVQGEVAGGAATRVAAGVKEARLTLDTNTDGSGDALNLALRWDSERAGSADGQLSTRLSRDPAGGWAWPADAPLRGQLRAQLPRIGVWSVLAPPGWRLRGTLGADVAISGTRGLPQFAGDLTANDLALRSVVDGIEFGNGRLRAQLDGTRMRISEFTLQGAGTNNTGGTLTAQGEAAWVDGKPQAQLDAKLDKLRASIRTDRQVTLSGDLQAKLDGKLAQFTGNLKVDQARILLPDEGTPQLGDDVVVRSASGAAAGQKAPAEANAPRAARPATSADARALKIAVNIDLGQDFRVQGKGMDTRIRGTLALTGDSITEPRLVGTVNTFGGQYRAYGQRLDVEQGMLRFSGPIDNPALDILAIRPNLTQRVGVQITGTALLPRVRLYAQPELPDAEKLSWLVVGRAAASGGAEAALLQQAALALLGSKSGSMSGGLAASLGLDELSYRGAANNTDGTTTEGAVTLGKRFSRNFYAAYERSISGALGTLFVFYDLSQRFTVRAQAGQQSAVDLIYTFQYD